MHQHRFRDALQTSPGCWALREPTRKERTGELAGRGRARARGCARPRAPGGAWPGLGAPGTAEAAEEAPAPLPPPLSPRVTGRTVWERPRSTRIFEPRWGRAGQPLLLKGKPKVRLLAPLRHAVATGRAQAGRFGRASLCSPQDLARAA